MTDLLGTAFGSASSEISPLQMSARATVVAIYGLALIRLFGRRLFGRWTAIDMLISVLVGSSLSRVMTGTAPMVPTLIATTWLIFLYWVAIKLSYRNELVSRIVKGRSNIIVEDGRIDWRQMHRQGLGERDLREAMREHGVDDVERIASARLERDGNITIRAR